MKVVLDSSVLVAAFREQEKHSRECFDILRKLEAGVVSAVLPTTVLLEVVAAIRRRTGMKDLAEQVGRKIVACKAITFIDINTFRMFNYLDLASGSGLKGMDVVVAGAAQEFGLPLVTLDKEMEKCVKRYAKIITVKQLVA